MFIPQFSFYLSSRDVYDDDALLYQTHLMNQNHLKNQNRDVYVFCGDAFSFCDVYVFRIMQEISCRHLFHLSSHLLSYLLSLEQDLLVVERKDRLGLVDKRKGS